MVVLYIFGAIVALLFGFNRLRVSVHVRFGEELRVWAAVGPKSIQLIPKGPPKARKKPKKPKKQKQPKPTKPEEAQQPKKKRKLTLDELRELLGAAWESLQRALGTTGRRIRIDPLYLNVVFGGPDPCDVAEWYGFACSAMWAVMPRLEHLVQIPDPELHFNVDFGAESTKASGEIAVYFRIGDFAAIGLSALPPALKWFLGYQKAHRKGAEQKEEPCDSAEEKIA